MEKSLRLQNADLLDRIQSARGRSCPPEGQGGRFPRQGQASGIPRPRASAGHAVHAGHDGQSSIQNGVARYPVGIMPVMDPANGRDAGRRARPPLLHDLGRLWPDHRQEHRARLSALGILPGGPQAERRIFRRDLPGRSGGRSATSRSTIRRTSSRGADVRRVLRAKITASRKVSRKSEASGLPVSPGLLCATAYFSRILAACLVARLSCGGRWQPRLLR